MATRKDTRLSVSFEGKMENKISAKIKTKDERSFSVEVMCTTDSCSVDISSWNRDEGEGGWSIGWNFNDLPFCCGIEEIGLITFYYDSIDNKVLTDSIKAEILAESLRRLVNSNKQSNSEKKIIVSLVYGDDESEIFLKGITKSKLFKKVCEFINKNSGNQLVTYISK